MNPVQKKITEVKPNPENPRIIKDDKFKKLVQSLKDFPEMAKVRRQEMAVTPTTSLK